MFWFIEEVDLNEEVCHKRRRKSVCRIPSFSDIHGSKRQLWDETPVPRILGVLVIWAALKEGAVLGTRYTSSITAGSLKLPESRAVASVLLAGDDDAHWQQAITQDNVLQAKSRQSRKSLGTLIRRRLNRLSQPLLRLVRDGSQAEATQACLAGAVLDSRLLGDFLDLEVRSLYRTYKKSLPLSIWGDYLEGCHARDPQMPVWSDSTINRLRSSIFQTLAEAGYINDTKDRLLQAVHIVSPVARELAAAGDAGHYALRCMEVAS